jgi:hypothetical protein
MAIQDQGGGKPTQGCQVVLVIRYRRQVGALSIGTIATKYHLDGFEQDGQVVPQ